MAVLISDRETDWREYDRAERFLGFIWRSFMSKKGDAVYAWIAIILFFVAFIIATFWK